jgi:hypothetical protein
MLCWDDFLRYAPSILQAVSITVTALFAIAGLRAWKRQIIGKRRIEVAEEALLAAYKARNAMSYVRNPASFGGEGATRPRREGEDQGIAMARDAEFAPLERLQKANADFAELEKTRLLCEVHFGPEAAEPFNAILESRNAVWIAASTLVGYTEHQRELHLGELWCPRYERRDCRESDRGGQENRRPVPAPSQGVDCVSSVETWQYPVAMV